MHRKSLIPALIGSIAILLLSATADAQTTGVITMKNVRGGVTLSGAQAGSGSEGRVITQGTVVQTSASGSVVLVFSNGTTVSLGPNSRLDISRFTQQSRPSGNLARFREEPSASNTLLRLDYGDLTGDSVRLKRASTFRIETPVGSAAIRGTTFRITLRRQADGSFRAQFQTATGEVQYIPLSGATGQMIGSQQEVVVEATSDSSGAISITGVTAGTLSAAAISAIQAEVNSSTSAKQGVSFDAGGDSGDGDSETIPDVVPAQPKGVDPTPGV